MDSVNFVHLHTICIIVVIIIIGVVDLQIVPIPMVLDNYAFVVMDKSTNTGVVIDPGDAEPIQVIFTGPCRFTSYNQ